MEVSDKNDRGKLFNRGHGLFYSLLMFAVKPCWPWSNCDTRGKLVASGAALQACHRAGGDLRYGDCRPYLCGTLLCGISTVVDSNVSDGDWGGGVTGRGVGCVCRIHEIWNSRARKQTSPRASPLYLTESFLLSNKKAETPSNRQGPLL